MFPASFPLDLASSFPSPAFPPGYSCYTSPNQLLFSILDPVSPFPSYSIVDPIASPSTASYSFSESKYSFPQLLFSP